MTGLLQAATMNKLQTLNSNVRLQLHYEMPSTNTHMPTFQNDKESDQSWGGEWGGGVFLPS